MKKRNIAALAGVAAVLTIGGSLAYFNQTMEVENNFDTAKFGSTLVEDFKPSEGKDWQPGVEVNKDVVVTNTGDVPVVVRVKMDEKWMRDNDAFKTITAADDKGNTIVTVLQGGGQEEDAKDGLTDPDKTVVHKTLNTDDWKLADDGWYYYVSNVPAAGEDGTGNTTEKFLDAVKLANDADMGEFVKTKYYQLEGEDAWVKFPVDEDTKEQVTEEALEKMITAEGKVIAKIKADVAVKTGADGDTINKGYSDAEYTLTITAEVVQATKEAVDATFGMGKPFTAPADCNWELRANPAE
ncbi:BsaA family SipW-dependent biofilm matrix protein [Clostridium transplantifaecale]|uniref:BsaA family SipW-dependent biofilm matrix protein n=1 Tax=Clostridium transplantifaecale TaxID=2479838 RepID=UPI0013DE2E0B|nr:BsaA family SipW-dependent biofilm matrix protein [Clostridium transplantifaecale]